MTAAAPTESDQVADIWVVFGRTRDRTVNDGQVDRHHAHVFAG
jgi:hypothetical protein